MFKKLFAILLALLMLCSCVKEEPSEPIVPEEPKISETVQEEPDFDALRKLCEYPGLGLTPCDFEGGYPYKAKGVEIPREVEELLYRVGRVGEFEFIEDIPPENVIYSALKTLEMADTSGDERFFPLMEEINNETFYPKEWVTRAAREIFGEDANIVHEGFAYDGFVYREKAGVYTPPGKSILTVIPYIVNCSMEEGYYTFYTVEFFYMGAEMSGYQLGDEGTAVLCNAELGENLFEKPEFIEFAESGKDIYVASIVKDDGGKYYINHLIKKPSEPELIAEHIAALNEIENETFFVEFDWFGEIWKKLYKNNDPVHNATDYPDALINQKELSGYQSGDYYNGYYIDSGDGECMPAKNFKTKEEVIKHLEQWVDRSVFDYEGFGSINENLFEYEGTLYVFRGSRGYGTSYYGDSEIVEQTETEMTAIAKIYRIIKDEAGTAEIKFEKIDGRWIIVSVEDNYY